jgi:hypothetical protein
LIETQKVLTNDGPAIKDFIEANHLYKDIRAANMKRDEIDAKNEALERKWVKMQRFIERARTVLLAANLPALAPKDVTAFYADLTARETRPLSLSH